jgi:hypothetical protein
VLFNHTWYLEKINVGNLDYVLANYYTAEPAVTEFDEIDASIFISICQFLCFSSTTSYSGANQMDLSNLTECALTGECMSPGSNLNFYRDLYFSIFHVCDSTTQTEVFKNPFTYTIATISNYYQLTVTNVDGDWAVYNSVLLSSPDFNAAGFIVFPNPIKESLQINSTSSQFVTATIYDISGKQLQSHSLQNSLSAISVKALNQGLYFVVFENEAGEKVSKKFVKN